MCIIAVSQSGKRQPTETELFDMFARNPHGAGYMYARNNAVIIHKGFMTWADFAHAIRTEKFTGDDPVIYHCRIATQAGIKPEMTHPFPLTGNLAFHEALDISCSVGIAHNGIIRLTADSTQTRYSDTSLFIAQYLTRIIKRRIDLFDDTKLKKIEYLAQSKLAILDKYGTIVTIGEFTDIDGILLSNTHHINSIPHIRFSTAFNYSF